MREIARAIVAEMEKRQAELDGLDRVAGDGDHGATMVLGARAVAASMEQASADAPIAELLKSAAAAFASVGGSIGPLWGSALLRAGQALGADPNPSHTVWASAAVAACDGVRARGRVNAGDKTLLDVLAPAAAALSASVSDGDDTRAVLERTVLAARDGLRTCTAWVPRRGRARRFGERSAGHEDPGAASACYVIETVCRTLGGDLG